MNDEKAFKYTKAHEWVSIDGDIARIGISAHAQNLLGDLVFVELPEVGESFSQGDDMVVVESVKAASDVYAPLSGEITEVNDVLEDTPGMVNGSPYQDGWLVQMKLNNHSELNELLTYEAYNALVKEED